MIKKLSKTEINKLYKTLDSDWSLNADKTKLTRNFKFADFLQAFIFVSRITVNAEVKRHHPEITLSYGKVKVILTTTEVKSLTKLDFELAQKIDTLQISTVSAEKNES